MLTSFEGLNPRGYDRYILKENMLYFLAADSGHQSKDGTWSSSDKNGPQYLCSINLDNGEFQMLAYINDSPYVKNNHIEEGNTFYDISGEVRLSGIYQGKVYMFYQFVENQQILIDFIHQNADDPFYLQRILHEVPWIYENKCFDLETGEITISELPVAADIYENTYLYWDEESEKYVALLGDGTEIIAEGFAKAESPRIANGKIWSFEASPQCFDLETKTLLPIKNDAYSENDASMVTYADGKYIIRYYCDGTLLFDAVTETELVGE